jgi:hypothetical protein
MEILPECNQTREWFMDSLNNLELEVHAEEYFCRQIFQMSWDISLIQLMCFAIAMARSAGHGTIGSAAHLMLRARVHEIESERGGNFGKFRFEVPTFHFWKIGPYLKLLIYCCFRLDDDIDSSILGAAA